MTEPTTERPHPVRASRTEAQTAASRAVSAATVRLRKARGLTQRALIKVIQDNGHNMHPSALTTIELGRHGRGGLRAVTVDELVWIAEALGVGPDRLLGTTPCPTCNNTPPDRFVCKECGAGADDE